VGHHAAVAAGAARKGIPPYGLGLAPMRGPLGRIRDRALLRIIIRQYAKAMVPGLNALRRDAGLREFTSPLDHLMNPDRLLVLTGEPLEYTRVDLPAHVRFVGAQAWDPPAQTPACLTEPGDPWVLVTCSTDYQRDEALPIAAVEALRGPRRRAPARDGPRGHGHAGECAGRRTPATAAGGPERFADGVEELVGGQPPRSAASSRIRASA